MWHVQTRQGVESWRGHMMGQRCGHRRSYQRVNGLRNTNLWLVHVAKGAKGTPGPGAPSGGPGGGGRRSPGVYSTPTNDTVNGEAQLGAGGRVDDGGGCGNHDPRRPPPHGSRSSSIAPPPSYSLPASLTAFSPSHTWSVFPRGNAVSRTHRRVCSHRLARLRSSHQHVGKADRKPR